MASNFWFAPPMAKGGSAKGGSKGKAKKVAQTAETVKTFARTPAEAVETLSKSPAAGDAAICAALDQLAKDGAAADPSHGALVARTLERGGSWRLRTKAMKTLQALGVCHEHAALIGAQVAPPKDMDYVECEFVREAAQNALIDAGDGAAPLVSTFLEHMFFEEVKVPSIDHKDWTKKTDEQEALADRAQASAFALRALAQGTGDGTTPAPADRVREAILADAVPMMALKLSDPSAAHREMAMTLVSALEPLAIPHAPAVRALLSDPVADVRARAVHCLSSLVLCQDKTFPLADAKVCLSAISALCEDDDLTVVKRAREAQSDLGSEIAHREWLEQAEALRKERADARARKQADAAAAASTSAGERESAHRAHMSEMGALHSTNRAAAARATRPPLEGDKEAARLHRQRKAELKAQIKRTLAATRALVKAFEEEEEFGSEVLGVPSSHGAEIDALYDDQSDGEGSGGASGDDGVEVTGE